MIDHFSKTEAASNTITQIRRTTFFFFMYYFCPLIIIILFVFLILSPLTRVCVSIKKKVHTLEKGDFSNGCMQTSAIDLLKNNPIFCACVTQIQRARFKITVRATDGGRPALWADVDVELEVVDRNNKPPIWEQQFYGEIYVKENAPQGEIVTTVRARFVD